MKIKINENWAIRTDAFNYILCEIGIAEKGKNKGESVSKREYFFPTLSQALNFALEKQTLTSDAESWGDVCDMITELEHDIELAINKAGIENCAVKSR